MQVVILCGGIGTRLKEETEFRPKPMVKIGDQPILWHIMKHYAHYGYRDFVLALGYRSEMIKEFFYNYDLLTHDLTIHYGRDRGIVWHHVEEPTNWKVTLVSTGENTLKGGRIKKLEPYLQGDTFLMTYGDGVSDVPIDKLLAFHQSHGKLATVTGVVPSMRFGEVRQREDGSVDFAEKQARGAALVNGGYYVLSRKILDRLTTDDACDFEVGPLEDISHEGELMLYRHEGFWHCMDTLRDTDALTRMWSEGNAPWKLW